MKPPFAETTISRGPGGEQSELEQHIIGALAIDPAALREIPPERRRTWLYEQTMRLYGHMRAELGI